MIRLAGLCGAVLVSATVATAAPPPAPPPPGGATVSPDGRVVVSSKACAEVVAHVPDAGVAYTPGVDVNGNAVAPADLPDSAAPVAENFPIFLTLDLKRKFRIPDSAKLFKPEAVVGLIAIQGNQVWFNGQPIAPAEASLLAAACRAHGF